MGITILGDVESTDTSLAIVDVAKTNASTGEVQLYFNEATVSFADRI